MHDVLALVRAGSGQFVQHDVSLARFDTRQPQLSDQAEVRLASAETRRRPGRHAAHRRPRASRRAAPVRPRRPEVRRASLLMAPAAPRPVRQAPRGRRPPRREPEPRASAPPPATKSGPARARSVPAPTARDERRPAPRPPRRAPPAPVRTAARDERRPAPGRATAVPPPRRARLAGRMLATQRPAREPAQGRGTERRRSDARLMATLAAEVRRARAPVEQPQQGLALTYHRLMLVMLLFVGVTLVIVGRLAHPADLHRPHRSAAARRSAAAAARRHRRPQRRAAGADHRRLGDRHPPARHHRRPRRRSPGSSPG